MKTFIFISSFSLFLVNVLMAQPTATTQDTTLIGCFPNEEMPEFPGGWMGLKNYLAKNFMYPQIAKDSAYEGKCYVTFLIDTAGAIKDARVLKGVKHCPDCDREAIRLMRATPRWKPGRRNGKPVEVKYNIPIEFKLM